MYKYFAFISYNSHDIAWGKRLQKKLEGYRMQSTICSEHGWKRNPINPVFFAPTDIQPGGLSSELQERLKASRNLIVICSPNSAKSEWVGKEIEFFHSLGRTDNIYFFIVDGIPNSGDPDTECINSVVTNLGLPEILGANVHEKVSQWPWINRERAYIQLITKLLGIEFDSIWQRHKRILFEKCVLWILGIVTVLAIIAGVWANNQPVDVTITATETSVHNDHLPPLKDAVVTLTIDNETKTDTIESIDIPALFANIPHSTLGKEARIRIECRYWLTTDTTLVLGEHNSLNIARDPKPFGNIQFKLWNSNLEKAYPGTVVSINGHETTADADGMIRYTMPLAEQDTIYIVKSLDLQIDNTLRMPTTQSTIIEVK